MLQQYRWRSVVGYQRKCLQVEEERKMVTGCFVTADISFDLALFGLAL